MADFWTGESANFEFVSQTQQSDKDCYVVVKCLSSVSKNVKFPTLKYSINGSDWYNCTDLYPGEGDNVATNVTASPSGVNHTFAWNSDTNLGSTFDGNVKLKFGVKNQDDSGSETQKETGWFLLDFAAPVCSVSWPHGTTIGDATPLLERNATDNSPPIETDWVIDDDPTFADGNGRRQIKTWSADTNFQTAMLTVMGTWYFKIRCRDSSPSVNTSAWDESGEFDLLTEIKPYSLTDGIDTIASFIVDEVAVGIHNRLREYDADGDIAIGGANIVEWVHRKPLRITFRFIDGPDPSSGNYERYEKCMEWMRLKTPIDIHGIGDSPISIGGTNVTYTPNDWVILTIRIINRPMKPSLLYYELVLEEL